MKTKKYNADDISKFVLDFIEKNKDEKDTADSIIKKWSNPKTKTALKKFIKVKKSVKDSNKPKKIGSAYILFCGATRDKVKADNPGLNNKEILGKLASLWKTMKEKNNKEYKKYNDQYLKNKEEYLRKLDEYNKSLEATDEVIDDFVPEIKSKKEKKKKLEEPKFEEESDEHVDRSVESDRSRHRDRSVESDRSRRRYRHRDRSDDSYRSYESDRSRRRHRERDRSVDREQPVKKTKKDIYSGEEYEAFYKKKEKKIRKSYPELSEEDIVKKINKKWKKQIKN
jgi:hypothetical protein